MAVRVGVTRVGMANLILSQSIGVNTNNTLKNKERYSRTRKNEIVNDLDCQIPFSQLIEICKCKAILKCSTYP